MYIHITHKNQLIKDYYETELHSLQQTLTLELLKKTIL